MRRSIRHIEDRARQFYTGGPFDADMLTTPLLRDAYINKYDALPLIKTNVNDILKDSTYSI
jgi:hypothetical protein